MCAISTDINSCYILYGIVLFSSKTEIHQYKSIDVPREIKFYDRKLECKLKRMI